MSQDRRDVPPHRQRIPQEGALTVSRRSGLNPASSTAGRHPSAAPLARKHGCQGVARGGLRESLDELPKRSGKGPDEKGRGTRRTSAEALPGPAGSQGPLLAGKGVCLARAALTPCKWPRCDCRVDLVYTTAYKAAGIRPRRS